MVDFTKDNIYYQDNSNKEHHSQIVGWKNDNAQRNRFDALSCLLREDIFTLNDIGAGLGDFYSYLTQKNYKVKRYRGYDLLFEMVEQAQKIYKDQEHVLFECSDIDTSFKQADYSIASGIFNLKHDNNTSSWENYITNMLHRMDKASQKGFAFNMLTSYSDKDRMVAHLHYGDPSYYFDYCKTHFSKNIALLHDYGEYDFTILVRKC